MDFTLKQVTKIPIHQLWSSSEYLAYHRGVNIDLDQIKNLIDSVSRFAVADLGQQLRWLDKDLFLMLWKSELKERIVHPESKIDLGSFPENYAFIASEWTCHDGSIVILFEKYH